MFLSDPIDCNSSDVIDFVFWSFCKLDADRAPMFVAAPIMAKHQNTNFNGSIRHGYFNYIEIAMTGDDGHFFGLDRISYPSSTNKQINVQRA